MNHNLPQVSAHKPSDMHWMSRMLGPKSIALVGVSPKPDSFGQRVINLLRNHKFSGRLFLVNPKYSEVEGVRCYPCLDDLPEVPDLVVMVTGSHATEAILDQATEIGAGGVVIFANNYLQDDASPPLLQRLKEKSRASGIPVCGGNGMGFYNYDSNTLVSFDFPPHRLGGHIAFVAHSGSAMTCIANTDPRLRFNLVVSPGQEINGTVADYMLYALNQPSTRVVAIFVETIRDPQMFIHALQVALNKNIPVVIVKVGATEQSARMAASHSGAIAGSDSAFQAICDHYCAIRVADMDELAATALAFSQSRQLGQGNLSSLLDSGGLREQMIDLAGTRGVSFTNLTEASRKKLSENLEFGLVAENPVDAMGALNAEITVIYRNCLEILAQDPGTAMISMEFEFRDEFCQYPELLDVAREFGSKCPVPFIMINSTVNVNNQCTASELGQLGIPVINGVSLALSAMGNMFRYRDRRFFEHTLQFDHPDELTREKLTFWQGRLQNTKTLDESGSLELLTDFNLPCVSFRTADNLDSVLAIADDLTYPVVLKSATPDLNHKSDVDGVRLSIGDAATVREAYIDLSTRLGPDVIVAPMIEQGVELAFGMVNDAQFGPVIMVCAGGIYIELLEDRRFIPAPCSVEEAMQNIQKLKISKILNGVRGRPPCRVDLAARALSDFSRVAYELQDFVSEIDLNPVIVGPDACTIVDALVVTSSKQ
jgi:acyl-CoA synthetase (NDP forming)